MSNKFGKIKTADELEKAILSVKVGQKALGAGIKKDGQYLLDSMKPSNLVNQFVSNLVPSTTLSDAGIGIVQGIKKIFTVPDKSNKPAKKSKSRKKKEDAAEDAAAEAAVVAEEVAAEAKEAAEVVAEAVEPEPEAE